MVANQILKSRPNSVGRVIIAHGLSDLPQNKSSGRKKTVAITL
jgi:hypothetical protein